MVANPVTTTASTGTKIAAGAYGAMVKAGLDFLLAPPSTKAYRTAALSIAHNTWTAIAWDTELWDTYGDMHDPTVNPSRFLINNTGRYDVRMGWNWNGNTAGTSRQISCRKNAAGNPVAGTVLQYDSVSATAGNFGTNLVSCQMVWEEYLTAGEYLEGFAYQDCGAGLAPYAVGTTVHTWMSARWVALS
jgi:hypothetical protein